MASFLVTVEVTTRKELVCDNCTKQEAECSPFDYAIQEREIEQIDYIVLSVKPNK